MWRESSGTSDSLVNREVHACFLPGGLLWRSPCWLGEERGLEGPSLHSHCFMWGGPMSFLWVGGCFESQVGLDHMKIPCPRGKTVYSGRRGPWPRARNWERVTGGRLESSLVM